MTPDLVVVGGGIIGLSAAWRCAKRGLDVVVCDPEPGRHATHASAGMLAPVTEAHYGEEALLRLNLASATRWPSFAAELEDASGLPVGYRPCGSVAVAFDADDNRALDDLEAYHRRLGLRSERLGSTATRDLEPMLSPRVRGGLAVEDDHNVDNRLVADALIGLAERGSFELRRVAVQRVLDEGGRVVGVEAEGGERLHAGQVLLAAGCWSNGIDGVPEAARPPVRPVKGQILRVQGPADPPVLSRNVRGLVRGMHLYLVPRASGRIVIGATVEEQGYDTTVTAGAVHDLLRDATELVPALAELELVEALAGLRPGTPDNAPLVGPTPVDGLLVATGHYRNGVLLAPITADAVADAVGGGEPVEEAAAMDPGRFVREAVR